MVDVPLPIEWKERPLRYLFLDLNSFFASVEQQEHPELRGKPVAVVPVEADTSFVIAASYEAKARGVRTLLQIGEAKRRCPELICVTGNHPVYSRYHKRIVEVAETILPVDRVCSIDEMRFRLLRSESSPGRARELAITLKQRIRAEVGDCLTSSIGIAPNAFLAKVGTELQKPDGLVVIQADDLPRALHPLELTGFPGINRRMEVRLNAAGIFTSAQLCAAPRSLMTLAFGSIVGERWWYLLRGVDVETPTSGFGVEGSEMPKSLGNSHVLAPRLRDERGCREVLMRLIEKASARLRKEGLWTEEMHLYVKGFRRSWEARVKLPPTQDTVTLMDFFRVEWERRAFEQPTQVAVTFTRLCRHEHVTPSLFDPTMDRSLLSRAVDEVNQKFGKHKVFLGGVERAKDAAEERIAFGKTELFREGAGDHEA